MAKGGDWGGGGGDPGAPLTNFNDRGALTEVRILNQKNHNFRMCLLKKVTTFFSIPKKYLNLFFITQKNPGFFLRSKRIFFGQNFWGGDSKKLGYKGGGMPKICMFQGGLIPKFKSIWEISRQL